MDLNAFWGLAEPSGVGASDRGRRRERPAAVVAALSAGAVLASSPGVVRGMCSGPVGEAWDPGDLAEVAARVPRSGALFGKVA